jgi:hypothetical protein
MSDIGTRAGGVGRLTEEVRRWLGGGEEDELAALIVALELSGDAGPGLARARRALREALSCPVVTAAEPLARR